MKCEDNVLWHCTRIFWIINQCMYTELPSICTHRAGPASWEGSPRRCPTRDGTPSPPWVFPGSVFWDPAPAWPCLCRVCLKPNLTLLGHVGYHSRLDGAGSTSTVGGRLQVMSEKTDLPDASEQTFSQSPIWLAADKITVLWLVRHVWPDLTRCIRMHLASQK